MAVRSQYQYQAITGPVLVPVVVSFDPATLDWLPGGQQPARWLLPNKLGDFAPVQFEALYKSEGLQWTPSGQQPARGLQPNKLGDFNPVVFEALYKPSELGWWRDTPSDRLPRCTGRCTA